jgi:hypothetical protein
MLASKSRINPVFESCRVTSRLGSHIGVTAGDEGGRFVHLGPPRSLPLRLELLVLMHLGRHPHLRLTRDARHSAKAWAGWRKIGQPASSSSGPIRPVPSPSMLDYRRCTAPTNLASCVVLADLRPAVGCRHRFRIAPFRMPWAISHRASNPFKVQLAAVGA